MSTDAIKVIVVGGGHAGAEAAWTAANRLGTPGSVALLTMDPSRIGALSCNPAIGGLAKGQLVRELDALGGLMPLAADLTGIQFRILNTSKGAAVHGPRCQSDKDAYPTAVQQMIGMRPEIRVIAGSVEDLLVQGEGADRRIVGVHANTPDGATIRLEAPAVILTTGTFMRGLMHTGEERVVGGRAGEGSAEGISGSLKALGFELGRLRTGTPPRLDRTTIDWEALPEQFGDDQPQPFSDLSINGWSVGQVACNEFPVLEQVSCRQTTTAESAHEHIRANLDRAPMYSGHLADGPRYCPSIEDKVVRFADRTAHNVYLEPEGLSTDSVYCNGIATSLPADVQEPLVHSMPGCERATILRFGYAVEYDMVRPHQIHATGMARSIRGLFLAGQINGTSGYEEAAVQGWVAGINAVSLVLGDDPILLGRHEAFIGVLMDDLVTKTPREPYRMFTSRAEHRLMLRSDNAADRLTPVAERLGLLDNELGRERLRRFTSRQDQLASGSRAMEVRAGEDKTLAERCREAAFGAPDLGAALGSAGVSIAESVTKTLHAESRYAPYIERERVEIERRAKHEHQPIPAWIDYPMLIELRNEARDALARFQPATLGQASRLEGITPSDVTLLRVLVERERKARRTRTGDPS